MQSAEVVRLSIHTSVVLVRRAPRIPSLAAILNSSGMDGRPCSVGATCEIQQKVREGITVHVVHWGNMCVETEGGEDGFDRARVKGEGTGLLTRAEILLEGVGQNSSEATVRPRRLQVGVVRTKHFLGLVKEVVSQVQGVITQR